MKELAKERHPRSHYREIAEFEEARIIDLEHWQENQFWPFIAKLSAEMFAMPEYALMLLHYASANGFREYTQYIQKYAYDNPLDPKDSELRELAHPLITWGYGRVIVRPGWTPMELTKYVAEACSHIYATRTDRFSKNFPSSLNWLAQKLYYNYPENRFEGEVK